MTIGQLSRIEPKGRGQFNELLKMVVNYCHMILGMTNLWGGVKGTPKCAWDNIVNLHVLIVSQWNHHFGSRPRDLS